MQLWEQERFRLDDDVNEYLSFPVRNPRHPDTAITFRHLLTHTSSIRDGDAYEESYACGDPTVTLAEWIEGYFQEGGAYYDAEGNYCDHAPGTEHEYSNVAFGLIGYLVERLSGMDFAAYCKQHIFEPLKMTRTGWRLADIDESKHARPYRYVGTRRKKPLPKGRLMAEGAEVREGFVPYCLYSFPNYPDGLVRTSVGDLARFLMAYLNEGELEGTRILRASTVREMLRSHVPVSDEGDAAQGLCWYCGNDEHGRRFAMHSGGDPGVSTLLAFCPEERIGGIIFCNSSDHGLLKEFMELLLQGEATSQTAR
ncbi:MAG: serine hydrolase, partial [bacterium]|nr:serine hydrolase [bacterium]